MKRMSIVIVITLLGAGVAFLPAEAGAYWLTDSFETGAYPSMDVDDAGIAHVCYHDAGVLYYANNASGSWTIEVVDDTVYVDIGTSLVVDGSGKVHISYFDNTNDHLKYATNATGSWVIETADSTGSVGWYSSLALDDAGNAHIAYARSIFPNWQLKYATNAGEGWSTETVDNTASVGTHPSIAVDSFDRAHISYYDSTNLDLKYATNATGSWIRTTVDSAGYKGSHTAIAVDASDHVHISYHDSSLYNLKYATNSGGSWDTRTVDDGQYVGTRTAIGVDKSGDIHIAYADHGNGLLRHAVGDGTTWSLETVGSSVGAVERMSLAIDDEDGLHIGHSDDGAISYATNSPMVLASPDVKADGLDGPVVIGPGDTLAVTCQLQANAMAGGQADWWVLASTPFGWYHYDKGSKQWLPGPTVTHQGPLADIGPLEVLNQTDLPLGSYQVFFGVDMTRNGSVDLSTLIVDVVEVTVSP